MLPKFNCNTLGWKTVPFICHMLLKFEQNRMVQITQIFDLKTIFDKALMPFWKMFL